MIRSLLAMVIVAELGIGAWSAIERSQRPVPPLPDTTGYHHYTKLKLGEALADCNPHRAADWSQLSDIFFALGFYSEAEACCRQAVALDGESPELRYLWGFCLSSMGQFASAREQFEQAIALGHPRATDCWYFIAMDHMREEDIEAAREALGHCTSLPAARFELAKLEFREGHPEQALPIVSDLQESHPDAWRVHFLRSQIEAQVGNSEPAANYRELADRTSGKIPSPWNERAKTILALYEERNVRHFLSLGAELLAHRDVEGAQALFTTEGGDDFDPVVEDLASDLALAQGDKLGQIAALERIIEQDGANSYRLSRLGFAQLAQGDVDGAIESLETGIRLHTGVRGREVIDMHEQLAEVSARSNQPDLAQQHLGRARYLEAIDLLRWGRAADASQTLDQSVKADDGNASAWFYLGEIHRLYENNELALTAYRNCLTIDPDHGRARVAEAKLAD